MVERNHDGLAGGESSEQRPVTERLEHMTEEMNRILLLNVDEEGVHSGARTETTETGEERPEREAALLVFLRMRHIWNQLADAGMEGNVQRVLAELFEAFLRNEREEEGEHNFTFKNAHNAIVRLFDDPRFHEALMTHFMRKEETARADNDQETLRLAIQAKEFDANRKRRLSIHQMQQGIPEGEWQPLLDAARSAFHEALRYWRDTGDSVSQARVVYEFAQIETELNNWDQAAAWQEESAQIAEQAGDEVSTCIALISRDEALLKGGSEEPSALAERLADHTAAMRRLAQEGNTTAQSWVPNALKHQAEAAVAAAKQALESGGEEQARILRDTAVQCCWDVLDDTDGYLAELAEGGRLVRENTASVLAEAQALDV